jgi:DNA-binding HxlR family transcriptional regulator
MKVPYGWIRTRTGYRKLTPKAFNKRLRRAHNRRLMKRTSVPTPPPEVNP